MRTQWRELTEQLQTTLAEGLNSLGGRVYAGVHDAFVFYSAVQINRAVLGYIVLARAGHDDSATLLVRPAIEAMFRLKAVRNRPETIVQIAFGEMRQEKNMVDGFSDSPDKARAQTAIEGHWREFREAYQLQHPEHSFVETKASVEQLAKIAEMESVYDTHYRLYCKFTHASLRAVIGDLKSVTDRDAGIMAVIVMIAIEAVVSLGATASNFADLDRKFRELDIRDRAEMSDGATS